MRSIQTKILICIGFVTIVFSLFVFYQAYFIIDEHINEEVEKEIVMALRFDLAIRTYLANRIRPLMYDLVGKDEFIPETMSTSYVARSIFEEVRKEFPDYIIKFSSDDPRNPVNQAGPEELKIIDYFNNNPGTNRWEGMILIDGRRYMAKFSARRMKESCLRCHGDPKDAPESLLEKYGSTAGFYRSVGKVIGMDTVAIPMDKIIKKLWSESIKSLGISGMAVILFLFGMVIAFKFFIINRLSKITEHFKHAANQEDYKHVAPVEVKGKDEINTLASSFNTLVGKLKKYYSSLEMQVIERTMAIDLANDQLRQEINDRQKVEEALIESEEKYRTVLAANPDPVVVYDKGGKVIYFNHAFTRVFGWDLHQCIHKKMDFFVPEQNWTETRKMIEKVKAGEDFSGIESQRFTKQGEIIDVSLSAAVYRDSGGNPVGSIVNLRDITQKKLLRAEAMRAGHLASLGELAAGVAHEINNPISGIIGYAEVLKDSFEEQGQDDDIPKKIIKEGERIAEIVKNLLSFARDREEEHTPVDVMDILSDALGLVEKQIIKDGIKFSINIPDDLPKVKARSKEIQQVFLNIISNARYALNKRYLESHEEKIFEITGEITEFQGRKYVRIKFHDRGIGMSGNIVNRISDPFFSTKPPGDGAGLGLSISHGILENHGGRLWFESVEGEYTEAVVDLPVDNRWDKI
jgi:two-component system, cell cycle sensor histidine kinase and response regulator CckA